MLVLPADLTHRRRHGLPADARGGIARRTRVRRSSSMQPRSAVSTPPRSPCCWSSAARVWLPARRCRCGPCPRAPAQPGRPYGVAELLPEAVTRIKWRAPMPAIPSSLSPNLSIGSRGCQAAVAGPRCGHLDIEGRVLRPARSQRRRQDHADQHPGRPDPRQQRRRACWAATCRPTMPRPAAIGSGGAAGTGVRPFFTVREALRIQSGYFGMSQRRLDRRTARRAWAWPTRPTANMRQLSGGMKRRVLVAQAWCTSRRSSCWTNPPPAWTWNCARPCGSSSPG